MKLKYFSKIWKPDRELVRLTAVQAIKGAFKKDEVRTQKQNALSPSGFILEETVTGG